MCLPSPSGQLGALAFAIQPPQVSPFCDAYLRGILSRELVDIGPFSAVHEAHRILTPLIQRWAHAHLGYVAPSGSFAKGTANKSGTDFDLLVSLLPTCNVRLKDIYHSLAEMLRTSGFPAYAQNVSIGTRVGQLQVDVVPARQHDVFSGDHSIFHKRSDSWRKTNVAKHIQIVRSSGRDDEIRLLKLWRDQHGLEFPSFYLELAVIRALATCWNPALSHRMRATLSYLAGPFADHRFEDPSNSANCVSADLTLFEKERIKRLAATSLTQPWSQIVR